ncbi:MAG: GNAT family N-acetyltransferase [Verrucomicrobiales bacterium]|nr:GNAT family N-acetyltransferase [Verrucomicrobiales bacterium]
MLDVLKDQFPVRLDLPSGISCAIRPISDEDEAAFRAFHEVIPEEEQLFIRSQIKDGSLFNEWVTDRQNVQHFALLAFVDGKLVAMGSLHQRPGGWKRHIGRVYFLTHPDYRGLGILDHLLEILVKISTQIGLTKLESELNGERKVAIESMGAIGFRELVRLPNYIRDMKAESHDYVLMGMNLFADFENLGAGD